MGIYYSIFEFELITDMKTTLVFTLTFCALLSVSCKDLIGSVDQKVEFDIDDVTIGGDEPADTSSSPGDGFGISTIYELNHSQMAENSHSDVWRNSVLEADSRFQAVLKPGSLETDYPNYPRIKRLANGKYLLLYMESTSATDCYYALSDDLLKWEKKGYIFKRTDSSNKYKNPDAVVLDNGDVLAVANYQGKAIVARRSTDNGLTWGPEQTLFLGGSMEPSALQIRNGEHKGEIHVYYTKCNTSRGYNQGYGDSGTGIIRSTDGGKTWVNDDKKIIRQYTGIWPLSYEYGGKQYTGDGKPIYTDQMAVGVELNAGRGIAVACESRFVSTYKLTMAYNSDNWTEPRPDEDQASYPSKRWDNWAAGAGPYLRQFPSGETLLSYRANNTFITRMGNSIAREFDKSPVRKMFPISGGGCWGSLELDDSHVMIGTYPYGYEGSSGRVSDVYIGRFILNHQIYASAKIPVIDGANGDWTDVQEALFIGSETPSQTVFRFAYSSDYLYILVERSDDNITQTDVTTLSLMSSNSVGSPFVINLTPDGKSSVKCDQEAVTAKSYINTDPSEGTTGYAVELAIPRALLNVVDGKMLFYATMKESGITDSFDDVNAADYDTWIPIVLKEFTNPDPEPEPKESDNSAEGPSWTVEEGTVNPW